MASPLSVGDIIAVGTLLFNTYNKCRDAPREYRDLARITHSVYLTLESVRCAVEPVFEALPSIHKLGLADAVFGIRAIATDISKDLGMHAKVGTAPGAMSTLRFVVLQNPREAESRLTSRLTNLNVCLSTIILYV